MLGVPAFSRSMSGLSPDGKATEDIKTRVSEELKEKLTGLAVLHGVTLSEYSRIVLTAHVYGHLHVLRVRSPMSRGEGRE
jgi:hypothetical protein